MTPKTPQFNRDKTDFQNSRRVRKTYQKKAKKILITKIFNKANKIQKKFYPIDF